MGASKPVHEDFARWYDTVSIGDNESKREKRWNGITRIVASANRESIEALLRLSLGSRQPPRSESLQAIRKHFKDADEAFEMSGNDKELQVLAAASIVVLMQSADSNFAEEAALAVTTSVQLGGRKTSHLPMDMASLAESAISTLSEEARNRPSLNVSAELPKFDFDKAAAKVSEEFDSTNIASAFTLAADATRAALRSLQTRQVIALSAVNKFISIQDEELQMLWWLTGQRSSTMSCAFDAVKAEEQILVFAYELAAATEALPGPASIKAIISRAISKLRKKVTVATAVNGPAETWLREYCPTDSVSPVTTPIHYAIAQRLEIGGQTEWVPSWSSATGINAGHSLSPLDLSELFYRERLLLIWGES